MIQIDKINWNIEKHQCDHMIFLICLECYEILAPTSYLNWKLFQLKTFSIEKDEK